MVERLPLFPVASICIELADQPVGVPDVTFGPDENRTVWPFAPAVMIAPPPRSLAPPVQVAVDVVETANCPELPV